MGDAEFGLARYKMFRKDRLVKRGGGVMLYFKEHIQAYEIQIEAEAGFSEAIWCNLVTGFQNHSGRGISLPIN